MSSNLSSIVAVRKQLEIERLNALNQKCIKRATELAVEFGLFHGGSLSVFRVDTDTREIINQPGHITIGTKTPLGLCPDQLPERIIDEVLQNGACSRSYDDIHYAGVLVGEKVYISAYKNGGDSPDRVSALLSAMNQFIADSDRVAA